MTSIADIVRERITLNNRPIAVIATLIEMDLLGYLGSLGPLSLKPFRLWNFAGIEQGEKGAPLVAQFIGQDRNSSISLINQATT